ncbi:MAG: beta-ketoacyl-ACP synthase I [Candidatus Pelagibacterales bacterium]|nr:MAG: beta-ketoacyl-ACP synthase I [Pelagibacterales bacterium]
MTRRVVITGIGIVSCIGNNQKEVLDSLLNTKSGIVFSEDHKKYNFRSQVVGSIKNLNLSDHIDRKKMRFMGDGSAYNYISMAEAIKDSGLEEKSISNEMTGIIMGSGGPSIKNVVLAVDATRESGPKKMGPCIVPRTMSSTNSATLAVPFKIKGINYSISSACATSAHCIGNGMELIQYGKQDIIFAGGGEELNWGMSGMFDAMTALSSKYNDTPEKASRPYDKDRDGFIIAGGAGVLVLEEYEHAKARGAKIYAELTGYGATSDGYDMVAPSGEGAARCMNMALKTAINKRVDYINSHGTSTPVGDVKELEAIQSVFKDNIPKISSTKSLTGHSLGATSVQEAIYCLLMMKNKFISASAHIENMDDKAKNFPIVTKVEKEKELNSIMSNSFGFGGTNATLLFEKIN